MKYCLLLILSLTAFWAQGQGRNSPKFVKSKGDYVHGATGMVFPEQINGYRRESIYSFSKQDDDIEVSYNALDKATVAIKIYSAGDGVEGRIRSEYLRTLQAMSDAKDKTIEFAQEPVRRVGAKYICNGFKATTTTTKKNVSKQITLYECGGWFLKIQIDATHLDSSEMPPWRTQL